MDGKIPIESRNKNDEKVSFDHILILLAIGVPGASGTMLSIGSPVLKSGDVYVLYCGGAFKQIESRYQRVGLTGCTIGLKLTNTGTYHHISRKYLTQPRNY